MKTHLVGVSMLVLGAAAAWAQDPSLKANVPFDFNVSGVTMPAGHYLVSQASASGILTIRSEETGKYSAVIQTLPAESVAVPVTARLVFRRYGEQYFLAETWTATVGHHIPPTKQERLLARGVTKPSSAIVAAAK